MPTGGHVQKSELPQRRRRSDRRTPRACDRCRLRKSKCNGACPCRTCIELEVECVYATKRSRDAKNHLIRMQAILNAGVQRLYHASISRQGFPGPTPHEENGEVPTSSILTALGLLEPSPSDLRDILATQKDSAARPNRSQSQSHNLEKQPHSAPRLEAKSKPTDKQRYLPPTPIATPSSSTSSIMSPSSSSGDDHHLRHLAPTTSNAYSRTKSPPMPLELREPSNTGLSMCQQFAAIVGSHQPPPTSGSTSVTKATPESTNTFFDFDRYDSEQPPQRHPQYNAQHNHFQTPPKPRAMSLPAAMNASSNPPFNMAAFMDHPFEMPPPESFDLELDAFGNPVPLTFSSNNTS